MPRGGARAGAGRKPKASPQPNPRNGRPTSYREEYAPQAAKLCALGATDVEVADFLGVSNRTIYRWAAQYPAFCHALKCGKESIDDRVERSLFHKAVGYSYDAVKIMAVKGEVQKVAYREHVPPDTTAAIFWLKNRRKDQWRDVHRHEVGQPGDFDRMTASELDDFIRRESEALGISGPGAEKLIIAEKPTGPEGLN